VAQTAYSALLLPIVLALSGAIAAGQHERTADGRGVTEIVLEGTLTRANRGTYMFREFQVPPGVRRIDVDYSYTGTREEGIELEIGIFDPEGFRGTSRFSKTAFFITPQRATPSYFPGPLIPGTWKILLGLPSIRDGSTSTYRVSVRLRSGPAADGPSDMLPPGVVVAGPAWYHGDLHGHTMHSDGFGCSSAGRDRRGCGPSELVRAGAARGLQFIALTDHNTTTHHAEMMSLQEVFGDVLLIRGQELTTFNGHANVYGTSQPIDYRLGFQGYTIDDAMTAAEREGALLSINHPGRATGERCTGCGWDAPGTDYGRLRSMEVVNSTSAEGPESGAAIWHQQLNRGLRITGIGGSDDHGAGSGQPGSGVGTPTTVVYAERLSELAILNGIRAGHVYIKTRGPVGPDVYLTAQDAAGQRYMMGDTVPLSATVVVTVEVKGGRGQRLEVIRRGEIDASLSRVVGSNEYRERLAARQLARRAGTHSPHQSAVLR
jgi:hypothetical protein